MTSKKKKTILCFLWFFWVGDMRKVWLSYSPCAAGWGHLVVLVIADGTSSLIPVAYSKGNSVWPRVPMLLSTWWSQGIWIFSWMPRTPGEPLLLHWKHAGEFGAKLSFLPLFVLLLPFLRVSWISAWPLILCAVRDDLELLTFLPVHKHTSVMDYRHTCHAYPMWCWELTIGFPEC